MRVRRPTWLSTALLACATAIFLAGCGATTTADPPASPPPASPTATAPTPPSLPPGASKHTKAGAIAFVRHYVSLINYAQATGDLAPMRASSLSGCKSCNSTARYVQGIYQSGGNVAGGILSITHVVDALPHAEFGDYVVDVAIRVTASTETKGTHSSHVAGGRNVLSVFPKWSTSGWKVAQWSRAK